MTTVLQVGEPTPELADLASSVEGYLAASPLSNLSDADLIAELRSLEVVRRQLQAYDNPIVAELDRRGLGASYGTRSTMGLLQDVLRLSPRDAHSRVDAARLLGERVTLTGDALLPLLPATAGAYSSGQISAEHVRAVIATVDDLPARLPVEEFEHVDAILATVATQCKPRDVTTAGIRILDTLGARDKAPSDEDQARTRRLMLHRRRDGSYELNGRLTPECGAETEAVLNAFAAPRPTVTDDGDELPDERTSTQRLHDALQDVMGLALRADTLQITGRRAQLIITGDSPTEGSPAEDRSADVAPKEHSVRDTATTDSDTPDATANSSRADDLSTDDFNADDFSKDDFNADAACHDDGLGSTAPGSTAPGRRSLGGVAWTSFGQALSARTAMWLCDTAMLATVTVGPNGRILAYGQTRRFATKAQLRVLIARDRGCSFPGCDHPPEWCDAHHILAWSDGGPTDIDNLTLLCGYHHRNFHRIGWECRIPNGIPEWIPPKHVDPEQKPRRNLRYLLR